MSNKTANMHAFKHKGVRIIAISDTHGNHKNLKITACDILIHCGDACNNGDEIMLVIFFEWFLKQPAKHKIFIAGNHDLPFDLHPTEAIKLIPDSITFLENQTINLMGLKISSYAARPWLYTLPSNNPNIDILITHGPPKGILDNNFGCSLLSDFIDNNNPKICLFGHIHFDSIQTLKQRETLFVNLAVD